MAMKIHKLAGIDIGSNSVRLLVSNVITDRGQERVIFKKSSLTRLPIRLGPDAFKEGKLGKKNIEKLISGMRAYAHIMDVHGVERYRACATSAMREASNGVAVAQEIYEKTGINIELINGREEARMIFNSEMIENIRESEDSFIYVDVGGGSTEFTLFHHGKIEDSKSFKIGTIRLLKGIVKKQLWHEMKDWIKRKTEGLDGITMVGSGGNINRTLKLSGKKAGDGMDRSQVKALYKDLKQYSPDERMIRFDLNPDRTDVITHALRIYLRAMKWSSAERIVVPKKGLADGIVRYLYKEHYHKPSTQSTY